MKWLRVWKTFQGGTHEGFIEVVDYDSDEMKYAARAWADSTPGGHNYGWTVYWEPIDKPSEEWTKKEIAKTQNRINYMTEYLNQLKQLVEQRR